MTLSVRLKLGRDCSGVGNPLAGVKLSQPGIYLGEEDDSLDRVLKGSVRRQILECIKNPVTCSLGRHTQRLYLPATRINRCALSLILRRNSPPSRLPHG